MAFEQSWGRQETIRRTEGWEVGRLALPPGGQLSLRRYRRHAVHWVVVSGVARVTRGPHRFTLHANESVFIPAGTSHRLENLSVDTELEVLAVQVGHRPGDDELERLEDAAAPA